MKLSPRHEAFAQARANGARLDDACEDAGFTPGAGAAGRLADRPDVAARIAGILKPSRPWSAWANIPAVIAGLSRIAKASEALGAPAGAKEARLALIDARRLGAELAQSRSQERGWTSKI